MTAIVGFNCVDGVVLAADTEETYEQGKAYSHKLFPVQRPHCNLCVAGSGLAYLIDYAKDKIVAAIETRAKKNDEFQSQLASILNELYKDEFSRFPVNSGDQLHIQLLVGVQFIENPDTSQWGVPVLFECQSNLVAKVPLGRSRMLGAGELLKETAIQFAGWGLPAKLAEWASIYLVHEAKRRFGGVGGKTHTCTMWRDGSEMSYPMGRNVREKETILEGFARAIQLLLLSLDPSVHESRAKDFNDAVRNWLSYARREMQNIEKKKSRPIVIHDREIRKLIKGLKAKSTGSQEGGSV